MDLCKSQTRTVLVTQHHCFILLLHYCSSKRRGPDLETLQKTSWTIEGWRHAFFAPPSICRSSESDLYKRNQKGGLSAVQPAAFGKFETVFRYPQPFTNTCKPPQRSKNDVSSLACISRFQDISDASRIAAARTIISEMEINIGSKCPPESMMIHPLFW